MDLEEKYIEYKGKIIFIKLSMPSFSRTLKTYAENEACFMFVNKGEVGVRAPEEYLKLDEQQAMLAKCLNYYFEPTNKAKQENQGVESIGIFLYQDVLEELFGLELAGIKIKNNYNIKPVQVNLLLENYKQSLNLLLDNPNIADDTLIETKLREFVQLMLKSQHGHSQLEFLSGLFQPKDIEFKKVIQQNLFSNLTIQELAQLSHLSESSFKRKFKDVYQQSPKQYILQQKLQRAKELLKEGSLRISDIAYDVGFDSVSSFNRNFKANLNQSPTEYRLN